ncbi:MAG: hypothetical protein LM589_01715 [Thermosphaera sp.]|nr:hypothetical protein [Thermosphaera sp.]
MSLAEFKKKILHLLREDEEFRMAVAGLIGLDAILSELRKLREDFNKFVELQEKRWEEEVKKWEEQAKRWEESNKKWEEQAKRWEENNKRWEENNKRWEENNRRWEEEAKRWEENNKRWEEAYKRFEAIERKLLEHDKRFEAIEKTLLNHTLVLEDLVKRVSRLELEVGALSEITLTRYVWDDLRGEFKLRGEEVVERVRNARVNGYEVDLLVETNKNIYIVEVKIKPTRKHVDSLLRKSKATMERYGKPVVPILAGTMIGNDVEEYAESKDVKVYKY